MPEVKRCHTQRQKCEALNRRGVRAAYTAVREQAPQRATRYGEMARTYIAVYSLLFHTNVCKIVTWQPLHIV